MGTTNSAKKGDDLSQAKLEGKPLPASSGSAKTVAG